MNMTTKNIGVSRQRRRPAGFSGFNFDRSMIPEVVPDGDGSGLEILKAYRKHAWQVFESLSYPTTKDEAWRRTDLRGLDGGVRLPEGEAYLDLAPLPEKLSRPLVADQHGGQIRILPGGMQVEIDPAITAQGVLFSDIATAAREYPQELAQALGQIVRPEDGKFAALAGALAENGVFVYVPKGVTVEQPLHSILWGPGVGLAHFSHLVIWLEQGASLTYVHEIASPNYLESEHPGQTFHSGIVEIHVGPAASLRFVELQSLGNHTWNITHERARVERDASLDWIFGAMGSRLTKNFSDLDLVGAGATGRMSGFYFTDGQQHLDHDTQQNHLAPHTTSDLLFKGALKGHSRSVWQGMIYVAPGAQKTDGYQANRNLVLSPSARADSIPGLEILADDVRCTHGATVGKIDPELVFYLRSRGIPMDEAERLVVEGFFEPIMDRIPFDGVRERFKSAIEARMS
jgi:Fe-S cluster assembly protein SufD